MIETYINDSELEKQSNELNDRSDAEVYEDEDDDNYNGEPILI